MATARERRAWALDMAAGLLRSDLDCMDLTEFDDNEEPKRRNALRTVANQLLERARKMTAPRKDNPNAD
jgi:hypothetical protein